MTWLTKRPPRSLVNCNGIPYLVIICSYMNLAVLSVELSGNTRASTHLVRYSVATTMYQHLLVLLTFDSPIKSNPHLSKSSCACEGFRGIKSLFNGFPTLWHVSHATTHSLALLCMVGHHNPTRSIFNAVVSGPMCAPAGHSCASRRTFEISSSMTHRLNI